MGMYSWKCAVSGKSIRNTSSYHGATECVVVCPDDSTIAEPEYKGYRVFGGHDIIDLVATWNNIGGTREEAENTAIAMLSGKIERPADFKAIKIVAACAYEGQKYSDLPESVPCPYQGLFVDFVVQTDTPCAEAEDGFRFYQQPDGSWSDADLMFERLEDIPGYRLVANDEVTESESISPQ